MNKDELYLQLTNILQSQPMTRHDLVCSLKVSQQRVNEALRDLNAEVIGRVPPERQGRPAPVYALGMGGVPIQPVSRAERGPKPPGRKHYYPATRKPAPRREPTITPWERMALDALVATGNGDKGIARTLNTNDAAVKAALNRARRKLGVANRVLLALKWAEVSKKN